MKENSKFNIDSIGLDDLLDQTLNGDVKKNSKENSSVINAESIENSVENLNLKKPKDNTIILESSRKEAEPESLAEPEPELKIESEPANLAEPESLAEPEPKLEPVILAEPKPIKEECSAQANTRLSTLNENLSVQSLPKKEKLVESSSLQTAQYLSIAQDKIIELQKNIETLHEENANIAAAGELWKQRSGESKQTMLELKDKYESMQEAKETEQKIFTMSINKQSEKMQGLKKDLSEADLLTEEKLKTYKLIASDLENRIEIIEREKLTLLDGKNNFISDLQKQINTLKKINIDDKKKLKDISALMRAKEQALRNTIKLLRQTLISLELGDSENPKLALVS